MMYSLAYAAIFIEVFALIIGRVQAGRFALLGGTLGNANYLALMLLIGAPFCLLIIRTKPGLSLVKCAAFVMVLTIPVTIAETGSRGGLVTLLVMFVLFFLPLPSSQKLVAIVAAMILAVFAIALSTRSALDRYKTIFSNADGSHLSASELSAMDSSGLRMALLRSSFALTLEHPLFGVGPGMFANANANYAAALGLPSWNAWHETHNTFTQLSCEEGIPGLLLYCGAIFFCFRIVLSAEKKARQDPALASVQPVAFCLRLALIAFTGTAIFASNAYAYYFPMLAGLCVALERAVTMMTAPQPQAPAYGPSKIVRSTTYRT
jgi:O-antigen ligase